MAATVFSVMLENTVIFSALFCCVWLVKTILGRRLSAALHCALWAVVIVKLLIPVSFTAQWSPYILWQNAHGPALAAETNSSTSPTVSNLLPVELNASGTGHAVGAALPGDGSALHTGNAPTPVAPAARVDWQTAAVCVWLAGAAVFAVRMGIQARRVKKALARRRAAPPEWMLAELNRRRAELGIRRNVRLAMPDDLPTPAVIGAFTPTLLVPASLAGEAGSERVGHVFLHELAHCKRNDLGAIWILNLVNVVYWFNPLVWLCISLVRRDMETACDCMAVEALGAQKRKEYIRTILHYSGGRSSLRAQAALGMGDGCVQLKRRIRGMFTAHKTSLPLRAFVAALACLMIFAGFTSGCQSNPSKPFVVQKDQNKLLQTPTPAPGAGGQTSTQAQKLAKQVNAPQKYSVGAKLAGGKLTVSSDAPVWVPDAAAMPVVRVKAADFTQQQADGLVKALFGGKKIYEIHQGKLSKADIDAQIVADKKRKQDPEFKSNADQASLDADINQLLEARKTAPDKSTTQTVQSDGKFKQIESHDRFGNHLYNYMGLDVSNAPNAKSGMAWLDIRNNNDLKEGLVTKRADGTVSGGTPLRRNASVSYRYFSDVDKTVNWDYGNPIAVDEQKGIRDAAVLKALHTAPAQARQKARDFLKAAGIADMEVRGMGLVTDSAQEQDGKQPEHGHYAYYIQFSRVIAGLPCAYVAGQSGNTSIDESVKKGTLNADTMKFAGIWNYETMDMVLDDTGILELQWSSPLAVGDTLNAQAALLPFDEIRRRFEEQVKVVYEPQAKQNNVTGINFQVTDVRLELQRIGEKDAFDQGLIIPVWNFYGAVATQYAGHTGDGGAAQRGLLITVNAVDGSIINRDLGY